MRCLPTWPPGGTIRQLQALYTCLLCANTCSKTAAPTYFPILVLITEPTFLSYCCYSCTQVALLWAYSSCVCETVSSSLIVFCPEYLWNATRVSGSASGGFHLIWKEQEGVTCGYTVEWCTVGSGVSCTLQWRRVPVGNTSVSLPAGITQQVYTHHHYPFR